MPTLATLLSWLLLYKYVALFAVVYVGALILPLPVNAALLAVGAFSSQHYFNFWLSLAVAIIANCLGDLTGYAVARHWGETVIRALHLNNFRFFGHLAEELRTDAIITIFITRQAGYLSTIANFLAGLVKVPFGIFLFFDFIGQIVEPLVALSIGYLVGNYWSDFSGSFEIVTGIVGVVIVIFILARISQRIAKKYTR